MPTGTAISASDSGFPHPSLDAERLLAFASPAFYRQNAFRILGLPVDATTRTIATRMQKLQVLAGLGRTDPALKGPFAISPPPGDDALRAADRELGDPQARLLHELFWFWPCDGANGGSDDAGFTALAKGDVDGANRIWQVAVGKTPTAAPAKHNLAVLWHLLALSLERRLRSDTQDQSPTESLSKAWKAALLHWDEVVRAEVTWNALAARVLALNDERLSLDFVQMLRGALPHALVRINALLVVGYAQRGQLSMADAHLTWVLGSRLKMVDRGGFAQCITDGAKTHLRQLIEDKGRLTSSDPKKGAESARALLTALRPFNELFKTLESETGENSWCETVDEVAEMANRCQVAFHSKGGGDEETCLSILGEILALVHREGLRETLTDNIRTLRETIIQKALESWYEPANAIAESSSTARERLARIEHELQARVAQVCRILDRHQYPKAEFLSHVGWLLRKIALDAWNNDKDSVTAFGALDLADPYATDAELKASIVQDRAALLRLVAAQKRERLKRYVIAGGVIAFSVYMAIQAVVSDHNQTTQRPTPAAVPQTPAPPTTTANDDAAWAKMVAANTVATTPAASTSAQTSKPWTPPEVGAPDNMDTASDESFLEESGQQYSVPSSVTPELRADRAAAAHAVALAVKTERKLATAKSTVERQQAEVRNLENLLDELKPQLEAQRASARMIGDQSSTDAFNEKVDRYNAMLQQYRDAARKENALVDSYNTLLKRLQGQQESAHSLIAAYNRKLEEYGH